MKRKILILGILFVLLAGLGFTQEIEQQEQEQGQPVPAPYLVLFRTQWDFCGEGFTRFYEELDVRVGIVFLKDRNFQLGIIDLLVIGRGDKEIPIIGWKKSCTDKETGFILETGVETKTWAEGEALVYYLRKDVDGNPVLAFIYLRKEYDENTKEEVTVPVFGKYIDLKKFAEENFKDKENPQK